MSLKSILMGGFAVLALSACNSATSSSDAEMMKSDEGVNISQTSDKLDQVLAAQSDKNKERFDARNPKETLMFFGVEPGMTVVEALPGGGWYTKILLPYLGEEGKVIGVDYALEMWPEFGGFADEAFIKGKQTWPETWTDSANEWRGAGDASVTAFAFQNRDASFDGQVDAALFIRAMHNLSRFEGEGDYMTKALADTMALLKPGGIVGVVQHSGPESNPDDWADGNNGYLKKSRVIKAFEGAGFQFVAESDINENPKDIPSSEDQVWRLSPTLGTSRDNPELRKELAGIGESNRMTLKFRKPL